MPCERERERERRLNRLHSSSTAVARASLEAESSFTTEELRSLQLSWTCRDGWSNWYLAATAAVRNSCAATAASSYRAEERDEVTRDSCVVSLRRVKSPSSTNIVLGHRASCADQTPDFERVTRHRCQLPSGTVWT